MKILEKQQETEAVVTREDQNNINMFSKCVGKQDQLKAKIAKATQELEELKDLELELELQDEISYKIGDSFVLFSAESLEEKLAEKSKELENEIEILTKNSSELGSKMIKLKTILYQKFGNSINLEQE